ncbi:hypothetical protein SP21_56 [Salmonella phage 21]|nr:hypothetical protein SP21_56 [Salmonella phage 21]
MSLIVSVHQDRPYRSARSTCRKSSKVKYAREAHVRWDLYETCFILRCSESESHQGCWVPHALMKSFWSDVYRWQDMKIDFGLT